MGSKSAILQPSCEAERPNFMTMIRNTTLHDAILALPEEALSKTTRILEREIRAKHDGEFPQLLNLLRMRFWDEYLGCQTEKREKILLTEVYYGLCTQAWFHQYIVNNPLHLSWFIRPPFEQQIVRRELIQIAQARMREVLDAPIYEEVWKKVKDDDGTERSVCTKRLNVALVRTMLEIWKLMSDRLEGAVLQRHKVQSLNLNMNQNAPATNPALINVGGESLMLEDTSVTMEELDAFEKKMLSIQNATAKIEGKISKDYIEVDVEDGEDEES